MPGGPSMMTPRGIFAPSAEYFDGFLRNSTTSVNSNFEPSHPATSSNVTPVCGSIWILDLDLPRSSGFMPPPIPPERRCRKASPPMMSSGKARLPRTPAMAPKVEGCDGGWTAKTTPLETSNLISSADCSGRTCSRGVGEAITGASLADSRLLYHGHSPRISRRFSGTRRASVSCRLPSLSMERHCVRGRERRRETERRPGWQGRGDGSTGEGSGGEEG